MKILIAGASGLIGQALVKQLKQQHSITVLGRDKDKLTKQFIDLPAITWNNLSPSVIAAQDTLINLAGENIAKRRRSAQQQKIIIESRVNTTLTLAKLCAQLKAPHLLNASAIGVYGLQHQGCIDETTTTTIRYRYNRQCSTITNQGQYYAKMHSCNHQWQSARRLL